VRSDQSRTGRATSWMTGGSHVQGSQCRRTGLRPAPDRVYVGRPSKWGNPFILHSQFVKEISCAWLVMGGCNFDFLNTHKARELRIDIMEDRLEVLTESWHLVDLSEPSLVADSVSDKVGYL
jgi:hypothetical protein